MEYLWKTNRLEKMLNLIEEEATGSASQLCIKLCVSRRTLVRMLAEAREMGQQISYCYQRKTYYRVITDRYIER